MRPPRVDVLGIGVDPLARAGLMDRVAALVAAGGRATLAYLNVHVLDVALRTPELPPFLVGCDLVICDGNGIRHAARFLGGHLPERMTGADWIEDLAARSVREGWTLAWIGGAPGVSQRAGEVLAQRHPGLRVHAEHGFQDDVEGLIARVNAARPHIVLVGMGTPVQERWVAAHRARIDAPVVWVLGATADFVSGTTARGPAWLVRDHEWLARLITEPRRLWRRYVFGHARVGVALVRARWGRGRD